MIQEQLVNFIANMAGGAMNSKNMTSGNIFWIAFFVGILVILIKIFLVYICYNSVIPELVFKYSDGTKKIEGLNFTQALFITILGSALFN
jgi:hypothetical protein